MDAAYVGSIEGWRWVVFIVVVIVIALIAMVMHSPLR